MHSGDNALNHNIPISYTYENFQYIITLIYTLKHMKTKMKTQQKSNTNQPTMTSMNRNVKQLTQPGNIN